MKLNFFKSYQTLFSKGFILLYCIYFTFFLPNDVFERSIPLLFEYYNFPESVYGLLLSVNNAISIFLPTIVAGLSLRFGGKILGIIGLTIALIAAFLLGSFQNSILFAIVVSVLLFSGRTFFNSSFGNEVNQFIPDSKRAKYFVIRDIFLFGGVSVGLFLGGLFIKQSNIATFYRLFSFVYLFAIFFISRFYSHIEKNPTAEQDFNRINSKTKKADYRALLKNKTVIAFILINALTSIYGVSCSFIPLLGTKLGLDIGNVLSMLGFISVINTLFSLIFAHITDNLGRKFFYIFDIAFDTLPALIFAFTQNIYLYIFGLILSMVKDAFAPISFAYFFDCFDDNNSSLVLGFISSVGSAFNLVVPIFVSFLWANSHKYVFFLGAFCNVVAALLAAFMLPNNTHKINDTN